MDIDSVSPAEQWKDLDRLLTRQGYIVGPGFEPSEELRDLIQNDLRILVIGAGGLGCELLKDLALTGFGNIDVIDMDTIDVSNLNRQFLFRTEDVGKSKAEVAAKRVSSRVPSCKVTPHFCSIESKDIDWYREFHIIALGLDSVEARSYINGVVCGFLEFDGKGELDTSTIKPMVDGGTEGFKGHARVIIPGKTPCFHCTLWLFPPQTTFPLCTLAETPRSAPHCIEYARLILWSQKRPNETFDGDNPEHVKWVFTHATKRAASFGILGVTYQLTQGVVKNIIPAIASTNAIISAACVLEVLKLATMCSTGMDNYMMYMGGQGVYTHTVAYERDPSCPMCGTGAPFVIPASATLQQFIDALMTDPRWAGQLVGPSVSWAGTNLYLRAPPVLEEMTRENLGRSMEELLQGRREGCVLNINDKKLTNVLRVVVTLTGGEDGIADT
eukprot:jgi/Mesvir1/2014/Mv06196-RA.1